jgi:hypothetical protein
MDRVELLMTNLLDSSAKQKSEFAQSIDIYVAGPIRPIAAAIAKSGRLNANVPVFRRFLTFRSAASRGCFSPGN